MKQEWIALIIEMDAVMRVCHSYLGTVDFSRPRARSFRGDSCLDPPSQNSDAAAKALRALRHPTPTKSEAGGERVAVGYFRLPVVPTEASQSHTAQEQVQVLQPPVVLRQFWRHPSWPDPDPTFVWQHHRHADAKPATSPLTASVDTQTHTQTQTHAPTKTARSLSVYARDTTSGSGLQAWRASPSSRQSGQPASVKKMSDDETEARRTTRSTTPRSSMACNTSTSIVRPLVLDL